MAKPRPFLKCIFLKADLNPNLIHNRKHTANLMPNLNNIFVVIHLYDTANFDFVALVTSDNHWVGQSVKWVDLDVAHWYALDKLL